jgi:hypothetical protein
MSETREPREVLIGAAAAAETASLIRSYWSGHGYNVQAWAVPVDFGRHRLHCVRSNLWNGLPPDFKPADFGKIKEDLKS